jgi:hypothetical protein
MKKRKISVSFFNWINFCREFMNQIKQYMKRKFLLICLSLLLTAGITSSYAAENSTEPKTETTAPSPANNTRLTEIKTRVNEIKAMDKSNLSKSEKKALRKELRDMKQEANGIKGGVYLSVGAIIIIILLLILIL